MVVMPMVYSASPAAVKKASMAQAEYICFGCMEPGAARALIAERRGRVHGDLAALAEARGRLAGMGGHVELAGLRERQLAAELEWLDDLEHGL